MADSSMIRPATHQPPEAKREAQATFSHHGATAALGRYMAEEAAAVDLISGGRLQLGVSHGSPESVVAGYEAFGHLPARGESDADMARRYTARFRTAISGAGMAGANPQVSGHSGLVPIQPLSPTLTRK